MICDLHDRDPTDLPRYDVCVVGSGPAGTTTAAELVARGLTVCVLESGRRALTRHADALKHVTSEGIHIKDYSRERVLGGASTTWAGLSSPLDPTDLGVRGFVDFSGWPLDRDDLDPGYVAAAERYRFAPLALFEPGSQDASGRFAALRGRGGLAPSWSALGEKVFVAADPPQNFGAEFAKLWETGVDLYLDATVTELAGSAGDADDGIGHALVKTSAGRELRIAARAFVLATGGLENARLLLASTERGRAGLGNTHDQVGRYLMNHPKNYHGILHLAEPVEDVPYYFGCLYEGFAGYAGIRLREELQAEREVLNSYVRFEPLFPWSDSMGVEAMVLLAKKSGFVLKSLKKRAKDGVVTLRDYAETGDDSDTKNARRNAAGWLKLMGTVAGDAPRVSSYLRHRLTRKKPLVRRVRLRNFMEMQPSPENRVGLGDARDVWGRPVPHVRHACTELDRRSLIVLHEILAGELEHTGVGRLETSLANATPWPIDQDASHHMGTTRMGRDPETSVVDPDGRLHDVPNVYCAGASVFPTSGCANPTFTIVALAVRLAEHLGTRVFGRSEARA